MRYYALAKLTPVLLPALFFWMWMRRLDRESCDPRPFSAFFIGGALLGLPLVAVEHYVQAWIGPIDNAVLATAVEGFVVAAIPEETARALFLAFIIWRRRTFATPKWIIGAAVALAMGQVVLENLVHYYMTSGAERIEEWFMRTVFCIPTLGFCGFAVGVATAWRRLRVENWVSGTALGLAIAILAHGLYDTGLMLADQMWEKTDAKYAAIPLAAAAMSLCFGAVRSKYRAIAETPA